MWGGGGGGGGLCLLNLDLKTWCFTYWVYLGLTTSQKSWKISDTILQRSFFPANIFLKECVIYSHSQPLSTLKAFQFCLLELWADYRLTLLTDRMLSLFIHCVVLISRVLQCNSPLSSTLLRHQKFRLL